MAHSDLPICHILYKNARLIRFGYPHIGCIGWLSWSSGQPPDSISQGGAMVARHTHHVEVVGSIPIPATNTSNHLKMEVEKTLEQKVADTLLQRATEVKIGDRTYTAAPPSTATLILVSEAVSRLPHRKLDETNIVEECLAVAKDCRPLGEIAAILLLGARYINEMERTRQRVKKSGLLGWFKRKCKDSTEETQITKDRLTDELLENYSPARLHSLIASLLQSMDLGDFFALTTFLTEINLTKPTREVVKKTTASGQ